MKKHTQKKKTRFRRIVRIGLIALAAIILLCAVAHTVVVVRGQSDFLNLTYEGETITSGLPSEKTDCILILGAGLWDGEPSPMLEERLDTGAALFHAGASDTILVSGDNSREDYNEVQAMEDYLVEKKGVPRDCIVRDHAGFSTYDSMARAKEIFCVESLIVVTQKYHLFRATYIASSLGLTVYGADAQKTVFSGRYHREVRECLARVKDFGTCLFRPAPACKGEKLPISG